MVLETLDKDMIVEIKQIMSIVRENVARHISEKYYKQQRKILTVDKMASKIKDQRYHY